MRRPTGVGVEGGGPICAFKGARDELLHVAIAAFDAPFHQIERADDHAQHIVEVMGDAAGQLA